ncbi:MAG: Na+/H+ antiporter subunit E [Clostridiales bacterium]|nr:Na+/H+ antiporter subunit E [Clostridiales bacterium]
MKKYIVVSILAIFFILFTEKISLINIILAVIVSSLVYSINHYELKELKLFRLKMIPLWFKYILILIKEIFVANMQVAKIALSKNMRIDPIIIVYESSLKGDFLLTILANSITLTPGTMSVDLVENIFSIHCLNGYYADNLKENIFEKILLQIEGVLHE